MVAFEGLDCAVLLYGDRAAVAGVDENGREDEDLARCWKAPRARRAGIMTAVVNLLELLRPYNKDVN